MALTLPILDTLAHICRSACIFYFIGRAEQYSVTGSWMGRHLERFQGLTIGEVYIYSFYLSGEQMEWLHCTTAVCSGGQGRRKSTR